MISLSSRFGQLRGRPFGGFPKTNATPLRSHQLRHLPRRRVYSSVLEVHSYLTQLFFCTFMAKDSRENVHQQQCAQSCANLDKAQCQMENRYDWQQTQDDITSIFRECFSTDPYGWQLDVTEAILLGLDSVVIAGTDAGKTMPFMMPLLQLDKKKQVIIIFPLKVLQEDQVSNSSYIYFMNLYDHRLHDWRI